MGVLDDAIREHLELKRQHGASQGEIEQQEQEALGPPGRQPAAPAEADAAVPEEPAAEVEPVAAPEPEAPVEPEAHEPDPDPEADDEEPEPSEPTSVSVVDAPPFEADDEPELAEAVKDEPDWDFESAGDDEPEPEEPARGGDTPPRGFERVEDVQDDGDEEDVLEETPDFLQETPEHDRLWFEQKPPRDFDFDDDKK